jgi:type IV conjugative transfer system coupling protein TraD
MKRDLGNFTRGSQLIEHFGFMFAAGLKGPLIIALVVVCWLTWWMVSGGMSDHEVYLAWMRAYAAGYHFMEFDPAKDVALRTAWGGTITFPISALDTYPPVVRAWRHIMSLVGVALAWSALLLVPLFVAWVWFAARFGGKAKERKHERGARLADLPDLVAEIRDHNTAEQRKEWRTKLGAQWRLCSHAELARAFPYQPSAIAGVTYPWRLEQSHAMLIGTTGMGKTVALSDMIAEARRRGQRAVIFDLTGHFIEHFHEASRDVILNPLDARCPRWSVFDECRDEAEFTAAAEALVPHDGGGSEQFWVLAARLLFVEMCLKLRARGMASNEDLARELMTADLAQVHKLMRGTVADPLTAPEAARMAESIRAVFNANAKALKLLPRQGPRFSMREWIENESDGGGFVFISARYVDMSVCSQLLTVWLDTAMNTLMTLDRTRDLRIWFFVDELGALHRLPALEKGLQTARNFGGAIVTGIHAYAKLKEVYGDNMAMTLSSLARTKLILGTADRETATWCSDFIGHTQVRDMEEGYTYGFNNARDAVSLTSRKHIEPLLLPDQLMNLPRLKGYLKFPDGFAAAQVRLTPVDRPRRGEGFIRRAADPVPAAPVRPSPDDSGNGGQEQAATSEEHPASNDDGAGKRLSPRQGTLRLVWPEPDKPADNDHPLQGIERADQLVEPSATKGVVAPTIPQRDGGTADEAEGMPGDGSGPARGNVPGSAKDSGEGQEPDQPGPSAGKPSGAGRSAAVPDQAKPEAPLAPTDPRRLALEDGEPKPEHGPRETRNVGDFDIDI